MKRAKKYILDDASKVKRQQDPLFKKKKGVEDKCGATNNIYKSSQRRFHQLTMPKDEVLMVIQIRH